MLYYVHENDSPGYLLWKMLHMKKTLIFNNKHHLINIVYIKNIHIKIMNIYKNAIKRNVNNWPTTL